MSEYANTCLWDHDKSVADKLIKAAWQYVGFVSPWLATIYMHRVIGTNRSNVSVVKTE